MPVNFQWQPSNNPPISDTPERIGLQLGGDDTGLPTTRSRGRIRLIEVSGQGETQGDRLIATFWGNWIRKATAPVSSRVTFEVLVDPRKNLGPFDPELEGFDPECFFGVDAFVLTFLNRRWVVWLPFYVDAREGNFLEIVAVAEVPATSGNMLAPGATFRETGRSAVLNLGIRRNHRVASTSNLNNAPIRYKTRLVGNIVTASEDFILEGQVNTGQATLEPRFLPVPPGGGGAIAFAPYPAGALRIVLTTDFLAALTPTAGNLSSRVTNLPNPAQAVTGVAARYRQRIPAIVNDIFTDAGFAGAQTRWQDDPAIATLDTAFRGSFVLSGGRWRLGDAAAPWVTAYWNFVVTHDATLQGAVANAEKHPVATAATVNVAGTQAFIAYTLPVSAGTKPVSDPIRILASNLLSLLLNSGGTARTFPDVAALIAAVDRSASKVAVVVAHEIGHTLGLMHTPHVEPGDFSEANGSPVLTVTSEGVDNGGFGTAMHFSTQVKLMWSQAFRVTPTFADTTLLNKTWTTPEVVSVTSAERTNRFLTRNGESGMRVPPWSLSPTATPPFAVAPPGKQRGTP